MAGLNKKEKEALAVFKQRLLAAFPERVDSIELFGSKARGEATKFSDVDVLVILRDKTWQDRRAVSHLTADILFDRDVVISPKTFSPEEFEVMRKQRSMFWQSIEPDLVKL